MDTIAPSPIAFGGTLPKVPKEMTLEYIARIREAVCRISQTRVGRRLRVARVALCAWLTAHEFYSPLANKRTDAYGGSFENRIRFMEETFQAVRAVWPERWPLTARISVTDWIDGGVTVEESIELRSD